MGLIMYLFKMVIASSVSSYNQVRHCIDSKAEFMLFGELR